MTDITCPENRRSAILPAPDCEMCVRPLGWLLFALWVFNVADLTLTSQAISSGLATESNGVMAYFLHAGPLQAALFKLGVVSAGVGVLWLLRRYRVTLVAAAGLAAVFGVVVVYQVVHLWQVTTF
jgi:Domain of unknown function (DUF5658)